MKIAIFSDIHEDYPRLAEASKLAEKKKCDQCFCLGDITGYSAPYYTHFETRDANSCVELVKSKCAYSVSGNHDLFALRKIPEFKAGFDYPETWYSLDFSVRQKLSQGLLWLYEDEELSPLLDQTSKKYLNDLPEYQIATLNDQDFLLSHFILPDISGSQRSFPIDSDDYVQHFEFMEENNCMIAFCGHAHPEGALIATSRKVKTLIFGVHSLKERPQIIIAPPIASSRRTNGFMIFDIGEMTIEVIPLSGARGK
ncbi:MAG: metallophosphatase family protein [Bacteroidetes bacterium]|nr:metallophosphatase family protein [Bacteroidota bacterium]MBU1717849.1 metallophosphatase family protein [Bacteroidota bacterium]